MKHKTFSILLAVLMSMAANVVSAYDACLDGIYYNFSGNEATVTYLGLNADNESAYSGHVTIPETVTCDGKTYDVTQIGYAAFNTCTNLTSVSIPNSVTAIDTYAFYKCTGLTSITIPNSVTSIGDLAFSGCTGLTSVTIPNSVTSIGDRAFTGCTGLTSIDIRSRVIGKYMFSHCLSLVSVTISENVTSIGEGAFFMCSDLTAVTIPNSVTEIDMGAFQSTGLVSVVIPSSVTTIGHAAFLNCSGLTSISVADGNPVYDSRDDCNAIIETSSKTLIVGCMNTTIPYGVTSIGGGAFNDCSGLTSVSIPNSVTSISEYAFFSCSDLTSVTIPEDVINIGESAFGSCTVLNSIHVFRKEPITINENTFGVYNGRDDEGNIIWLNNIYETATLYVPLDCKQAYAETQGWSLFKNIEEMAYADDQGIIYALGEDNQYAVVGHKDNLKSEIVIASEVKGLPVTSIGYNAFNDCSGLTSVSIPASVTSIGGYAFYYCTSLKKAEFASIENLCKIHFGDEWYSWGANPLQYAHHLYINGEEITGNLVIPESVTKIGQGAFRGCTGITSVTIPESVTEIGEDAFTDCKLRNVYVKSATPPSIPDEADDDVFGYATCLHGILYVPAGAWDAYAFDDHWCYFINIRETATEQNEVKTDMAYTLMDAKTFQYAVYDQVNNRVRMIQSGIVDENDPYHCWQTVEVNGKQFLYNIGAKKFAVPGTDGSSFTLSDDVRSITMTDGNDGLVLNGHAETQWALVINEKMSMDNGVEDVIVTAIDGINANDNNSPIYDLDGRQITKPTKGINIMNGKKILIQR